MKPFVVKIPCNSSQEIRLSEVADMAQDIELVVGSCAQLICIDDREMSGDSIDFTLNCIVKKNAQLLYCDQRLFGMQAKVNNHITLRADQDAVIRFEQWQQGGHTVKTFIDAQLEGDRSEIDMRLGAHLSGSQTHEINTMQSHHAAFAKSNCVLKVIVSDSARSLYEGMIQIDTLAQKSEAFQSHKAILLSENAYANARPSLQVHADDVQCGHGSAIGQIDEEQREYLYARGMDESCVQELLLHAFLDNLYSSDSMKHLTIKTS